MARVLNTIIPLLIVGAVAYVFRAPLWVVSYQALREVAPCTVPIPYAIGEIDPRFNISAQEVMVAAEKAIAVWEYAAGKDLFVFVASGTPVVTIDMHYDLRQETTETLKGLGSELASDTEEYDSLDANYRAARSAYLQQKAAFQSASESFDAAARAYEREVESWNVRGGAPKSVVDRLNEEKASLQARQQQLAQQQQQINARADEVNALADRLNSVAHEINAGARTYNKVGAQTGEEFEEGVYESRAGKETITVYEFDSMARLTRLLAHEFGHALGLDHVEGASSIMYRLNQDTNIDPTDQDVSALAERCSL